MAVVTGEFRRPPHLRRPDTGAAAAAEGVVDDGFVAGVIPTNTSNFYVPAVAAGAGK